MGEWKVPVSLRNFLFKTQRYGKELIPQLQESLPPPTPRPQLCSEELPEGQACTLAASQLLCAGEAPQTTWL